MDKATLPMGASRTKWINDAIAEKLDREHPDTIGVCAVVPHEAINPAKILEDAKKAARPLDYVGPYTIKYGKDETYAKMAKYRMDSARRKKQDLGLEDALELVVLADGKELGDVEKAELMQAPPAVVPVKQLESAPAAAPDSDFWGDAEISKVRALVKTHAR